MTDQSREAAVTRGEFLDAIQAIVSKIEASDTKTASKIDEINSRGRYNASTIIGILALLGAAIGFGVKNLSDVSTLMVVSTGNTSGLAELQKTTAQLATVTMTTDDRSKSNAETLSELRERTRGLEANLAAVAIENETQHKWMADVFNQEAQHTDTLLRIIADNPGVSLPERRYWPLNHFGEGYQLNGKKH